MHDEEHTIKVLSVCTNECSGGASIAAHRIHEAVNAENVGVRSTMFVKNRQTDDPSVCTVEAFIPHSTIYRAWVWIRSKIANKYWHMLWHPYKKTQNDTYKNDLRGIDVGNAFKLLDYDILHLHWINERFLRIGDIPNDRPIIWTLHDSWQMCGLCHYFLDCEEYKNECGCCPQLGSKNPNDLSHKVWKAKQKCYQDKRITVVCPSQWLADSAAASGLFRGTDIRVIPNCLDTEIFRPLTHNEVISTLSATSKNNNAFNCLLSTKGERTEKPYILFGAMNAATDRIKGFSILLSAMQILDHQGFEANLVVFGADETELPMCFKHIAVTFVGYVGDIDSLVALYNMADVMVVPSESEVFGQTASESMACGTPVVAFRCTGIQDVVGDDGGYLAEPYREDDLATGIEWVVRHNLNNEMQERVRKSAVYRFSIPVVRDMYINLYRDLAVKDRYTMI